MKKIAAILLSTILACSFMVGCGDEDDSSSKKADKNDSSVSSSDASSEETEDVKDNTSSDADKSSEDEGSKADESSGSDDESEPDDSSEIDMSDFYADEELIGKWQAMYVTEGDMTYTADYDGIPVKVLRFIFNKDNTGTFYRPDEEIEFIWSMKDGGGFAIMKEDHDSQITLKIKDGELAATEDDTIVRFKKVDEFEEVEIDPDQDKTAPTLELDTSYVGTWKCTKLILDDEENDGDDEIDEGMTISDAFKLELKADGTGALISMLSSDGESVKDECTWGVRDNNLLIYSYGVLLTYPVKNGIIEMELDDGFILCFEKEK